MIEENDFAAIFSKKFKQKLLKDTIVPCQKDKIVNFDSIIKELYNEIILSSYSPENPREYLFSPKTNYAARIIPIFSLKDECVYYFLIKMLEFEIGENRVKGTFGGWRLGNVIRDSETNEIEYISRSYNPYLWRENWKQFQSLAYVYSKEKFSHIVKTDIANFYDGINLNILEEKLYLSISKEKWDYLKLLMYFLRYWNKKIDKYGVKSIGIPQNEFGDQSRLLANFYLQEYDLKIKKVCDKLSAKYLRYADDQIIFANSELQLKEIMFNITKELNKLGLNLNAGKTKIFKNSNEFDNFYSFDIMELLDTENSDDLSKAVDLYIDKRKKRDEFNNITILRRLINIGFSKLEIEKREWLVTDIINDDFLIKCDYKYLKKIYSQLNEEEKYRFINRLKNLVEETYYNEFHYNVLKFYQSTNFSQDDIAQVILRIEELKL